jgi:hypothetical protein
MRPRFFRLVLVALGKGFQFADRLRAGDKRRERLEELIEHLASREQLFDRNANLDTIVASLFKGNIVAVRWHFV